MPSWVAAYGGSGGGQFRLVVEVDLLGQEEDNNRSLIQYRSYMTRVSGSSRYWNLYTNYGHTNINGYNPQRALTYDFNPGVGARFYLAGSENYWIGHDGNGNANPYFGADHNAANSPYLTTSATGGNYGLPGLYRYAAPNYVEANTITDVSFRFRTITNRVCDIIAISLTGGGNWYYFYGDFTDKTVQLGDANSPLPSDTTFPVRISLHRKSSGYWQEHGNWNVATLGQNKFFDIGDY